MDFVQNNSTFDESWMDRKKDKDKKKKKLTNLDDFIEGNSDE
jgi:hypothetical protein